VCIYLLVGFSFASIYGMLGAFQPNAFYLDPRLNLHTIPNRFDYVYYSFGTMTALGAAGINAVTPQARSISIVEAILGILYLAVVNRPFDGRIPRQRCCVAMPTCWKDATKASQAKLAGKGSQRFADSFRLWLAVVTNP